ncbi:hypothetical protein GALL_228500 [mine drainage metagenome]|uniref:Uncharacterized protein n=1 Tax=mine drainage metagenome TaxID=410659 RepID=A0A1J5RHA5_9ZZZZ
MKKLFKNFSWSAFAAYAIVFFFVTFTFDLIMGRFHEPNLKLSKVIIGYLISVLGFGFFMSLFFGKKVLEKTKKEKS